MVIYQYGIRYGTSTGTLKIKSQSWTVKLINFRLRSQVAQPPQAETPSDTKKKTQ